MKYFYQCHLWCTDLFILIGWELDSDTVIKLNYGSRTVSYKSVLRSKQLMLHFIVQNIVNNFLKDFTKFWKIGNHPIIFYKVLFIRFVNRYDFYHFPFIWKSRMELNRWWSASEKGKYQSLLTRLGTLSQGLTTNNFWDYGLNFW